MIAALVAAESLTERIDGIRGHFARGGRWSELVSVIVAIAGGLLLLTLIYCVQHVIGRREPNQPRRLFRALLSELGLTPRQCRLLREIAADLGIEHPTVMLLSPKVFREQTAAWAKTRGKAPDRELAAIAEHMFPARVADDTPFS